MPLPSDKHSFAGLKRMAKIGIRGKCVHAICCGLLAILLTSCGGSSTTPSTPAPIHQTADQQLASWLLTAQTAIEQAKTLVATNPGIKDPLNKIIAAYNTAESAYLTYHQAVVAGSAPDATALTAQISQLVQNVTAMVSLYGAKP